MNACGVIVEYNPFHNGHAYHLQEAKRVSDADVMVAVMSGNFLQRGEPAIISKWARTRAALASGVDIVIELPYAFAVQKADRFAYGAVSLLDALYVDSFCFGSEHGEIEPFVETASFLEKHQNEINAELKKALKEGVSFPTAASNAYETFFGNTLPLDIHAPNNILGLSYVRAAQQRHTAMKPLTIKRTGSNYHDEQFSGNIASATSVRKQIFEHHADIDDLVHVLPQATVQQLASYRHTYGMLHNWEAYFQFLKYRLLTMSHSELSEIAEVEEGLEYRLKDAIKSAKTFHEFIQRVKTKRYTWTRLQRLCINVLTHTTKGTLEAVGTSPAYIRLLGMNELGQAYLRRVKKELPLPLVAKLSAYSHPQLDLDIRAADTYAMCLQEPFRTDAIQREFSNPPVRI
ncbi:nucleotidyltransferase [Bacillus tianshenii]|nr:nucleotidyltransferase [Bacillus tianshenii]